MKIEVLNLKDGGRSSSFTEKKSGALKNLPETPEQLRWQMLTTLKMLRKSELANEELEKRLRRLTWSASEAIRSADKVDPKKRAEFEEELRLIKTLIVPGLRERDADARPAGDVDTSALDEAKVINVKRDLSLVVLNVGREQGVKLGMPFQVIRDGRLVAVVVVVDVRDKVCGALIERMDETNPVKVEDEAVLRKS